jgi:hypothetical protein
MYNKSTIDLQHRKWHEQQRDNNNENDDEARRLIEFSLIAQHFSIFIIFSLRPGQSSVERERCVLEEIRQKT